MGVHGSGITAGTVSRLDIDGSNSVAEQVISLLDELGYAPAAPNGTDRTQDVIWAEILGPLTTLHRGLVQKVISPEVAEGVLEAAALASEPPAAERLRGRIGDLLAAVGAVVDQEPSPLREEVAVIDPRERPGKKKRKTKRAAFESQRANRLAVLGPEAPLTLLLDGLEGDMTLERVQPLISEMGSLEAIDARIAMHALLDNRSANNYAGVDVLIAALCRSRQHADLVGGFYERLKTSHENDRLGPVSQCLVNATNFRGRPCFPFLSESTAQAKKPLAEPKRKMPKEPVAVAIAPIDQLEEAKVEPTEAVKAFVQCVETTRLRKMNGAVLTFLTGELKAMNTEAEHQAAFLALVRKRAGKKGAGFIDEMIKRIYLAAGQELQRLIYNQLFFMYDPETQRNPKGAMRGGKKCLADFQIDDQYVFDFLVRHRTPTAAAMTAQPAVEALEPVVDADAARVEDILATLEAVGKDGGHDGMRKRK